MSANTTIASYSVHPRAYLKRAKEQLATQTIAGMVYAALELRLGIERRQHQYAVPWSQIPEKVKSAWRAKDVARELEKAFTYSDRILHIEFVTGPRAGQKKMFTPVDTSLQSALGKLGNYLHVVKWAEAAGTSKETAKFLAEMHDVLVEGVTRLAVATSGTLLGPLLEDPNDLDPATNAPYFKLNIDNVDADGNPTPPTQTTSSGTQRVTMVPQYVALEPVVAEHLRVYKARFPKPDFGQI